MNRGRIGRLWCRLAVAAGVLIATGAVHPAAAQAPDAETRTAVLEKAQADKAAQLHAYVPNAAEKYLDYAETVLTTGMHWHPYFDSAYAGGGFTVGAGYRAHISPYNTLDLRGSITVSNYKRVEAEFLAPRLLSRQARLSFIAGWREATQVGYFGLGTSTSKDARANYGFTQPYGLATLRLRPRRGALVLTASADASQWEQTPGDGSPPSVEEVYTPVTAPGLGATVTYLHAAGTVALDWRESPGYARRGGFYGVTFQNFMDKDDIYDFRQVDYEAIQHVPVLRDAWVLSFRAHASTTGLRGGQEIPFFMLPSLGGGSSLRGFSSWRFRDRNSLELQAEWRILANRYVDTAVFYDAGKVTAHTRDLSLDGLKCDYGFGIRFHGLAATPLRIDFAKSNEGLMIVWSASAVF